MELFVPDIYAKSIFDINYNKLLERGIKCLIFDLDNTIAPKGVNVPDKKTIELFERIEEKGFKIIIVSNSFKKRVQPFKEHLNVDAAHTACKPLKNKYKKVMKIYHYKDNEIAAIGDQLLTDILGANRMGFTSILVNPISNNDFNLTKMNRFFEKQIYKYMIKHGLFQIGEYYD